MNKHTPILGLLALATLTYCVTAYTRPHEPAGRALQNALRTWCPTLARPELQPNEYTPRPTLRPLQVVPATCTPYTPEELAEIFPTH